MISGYFVSGLHPVAIFLRQPPLCPSRPRPREQAAGLLRPELGAQGAGRGPLGAPDADHAADALQQERVERRGRRRRLTAGSGTTSNAAWLEKRS